MKVWVCVKFKVIYVKVIFEIIKFWVCEFNSKL